MVHHIITSWQDTINKVNLQTALAFPYSYREESDLSKNLIRMGQPADCSRVAIVVINIIFLVSSRSFSVKL